MPADTTQTRGLRGREAAVCATATTSVVFALFALAEHGLSPWLMAASGTAILLTLLLFRDRMPIGVPSASRSGDRADAGVAALLGAVPDPALLVDRRSVVVGATPAAYGAFPTLRIAQPLSFTLRAPAVLEGLDDVLKSGEARTVEFTHRGGAERVYAVSITALTAGDDKGALLFFRDETAARRLEHMRVDFVANASHELRTPLASVMGFIETLQGPARNDAVARERFLGIMREQAQRMSRLIDDLLSLSRIEMRAHVQPATPVDVLGLVKHIIDTLTPLAGDRGVALELVAPSTPVIVPGDRDELLRVFENLIENAVKYGQSGKRVVITVSTPAEGAAANDNEISISVRDFGPGIGPEHVPRLTERFYRVDVAASRDKGGTGLGLAIVKHIVNHHRGRLQIESELGQGALFRVVLPLFGDQKAAGRMRG
ncbi:ATP-binding protein [Chelatococcus reniformis]|nr:ATP-binding protein [Chelatococcus reniformis]